MTNSSNAQQPLPPVFVTIWVFYEQRKQFKLDPPFQRKSVWTKVQKEAFIDTLLRGDPIPPLEAYEEVSEDGVRTFIVLDGHQRATTILDFIENQFRTWTEKEKEKTEPGSEGPVEPKKLFKQLPPHIRNRFNSVNLQFNLLRKINDAQVRTRFLRVQNHSPLTSAEKLNSYASKANEVARRIEQHPFWESYTGYAAHTDRNQTFQSSLQLLAIELSAPEGMRDIFAFSDLQVLASGHQDKDITDATTESILTRLDLVAHLYHNFQFSARAACVAMYQSVLFLEQRGYSVKQTDKASLTHWIQTLVTQSQRATGLPGYEAPIQRILYKKGQEAFWARHLKKVLARFGIQEQPT